MKLNKTRQQMYLKGEVGIINDGTVDRLLDITGFKFNGNYKYYTHQHQGHQAKFNEIKYYNISWFYEEDMPKWVKVVKADSFKWYKDKIGEVFEVINEGKFALGDAYYAIKKEGLAIYKSDCTPCDAPNEVSNELPKMVKYMGTEYDVVCKQDPYYRLSCGVVKQDDCTPINETNNELPKVGEWWECVENVSIDGSKIFTSGKKYKCEDEGYLTNNNKKRTLIAGCNDYRSHFIKSTQPTPTSYKLNIDIPEWVLKAGDEIEVGRLPRSIMEYIATPIYATPYTLSNGQVIILSDEDIENIKKLG